MRKSLWIVLTILFVAVCVPAARADSYIDGTISFTVTAGNVAAPPTGTFIYDATTQSFTSFGVTWDGIAIDLSGSANAGLYFNGCGGGLGNFIQDLLDQGCSYPFFPWTAIVEPGETIFSMNSPIGPAIFGFGLQGPSLGDTAGGTYAGSVSAPAPGSIALTLSGMGLLGLMLAMRKRLAFPPTA